MGIGEGGYNKIDYNDITTITVPNRVRQKLGKLVTHNETIPEGLERILDEALKKHG